MREFGSDFHFVVADSSQSYSIADFYPKANYYADGRQALIHLYQYQGWERLWMPEYYCYDVIESLKEAGLNLRFYADFPGYTDDSKTLEAIQRNGFFKPNDAILRVNYFGTRSYRSSDRLSVAAVIEDHTHDLIGGWAINSHADWCFASLRKSLPVPEGGMLWSPVGLKLPPAPISSSENEKIAATRWEAMKLKARYLNEEDVEKTAFRERFVNTEDFFDHAPIYSLDVESLQYLKTFNVRSWYNQKRDNWEQLRDIKKDGVRVMKTENMECYPFSLVLLFDSSDKRDRVRKELIVNQIYPAVLWNVPNTTEGEIFQISRGMLSIHCDGRYNAEDIQQMKTIIESILQS